MIHGELAQYFAIQQDIAFLEVVHQAGEGGAVKAGSGVDAHLLQCAVVALFELATHVGVHASLVGGGFGQGDFGFTTPHHALGAGQDVFTALDAVCSAFNSRHIKCYRLKF
ncbi:MAG: hypothetical protein RL141_1014 [Candidatus Parcubacteria bacterium]